MVSFGLDTVYTYRTPMGNYESTPALEFFHVACPDKYTFRLEGQVLGKGCAPSEDQQYETEYTWHNQRWRLETTHFRDGDYRITVNPEDPRQHFTYWQFQRTNNANIGVDRSLPFTRIVEQGSHGRFALHWVEVKVIEELPPKRTSWNFTSSKQMDKWDVILTVGETRFYAHKEMLSFTSTTFQSMFNGDFREKNQTEVPVNVDGTNAEHFEAFLQCLYPCGREPNACYLVPLITLADYFDVKPVMEKCVDMLLHLPDASNLDKMRIAVKPHSTVLKVKTIRV